MVKELISNQDRLKLCDELNTMTIDYANSVIGYHIYCKKCDVDKYLALGKKYNLNCHTEQKDDFYIVILDFYDYDTDNNETIKRG